MNIFENTLAAERILNLAFHSIFILFLGWLFTRLFRHKAATLRSAVILATILTLMVLPFFNFTFLSHKIVSFKTELPIAVTSSPLPREGTQNALLQQENLTLPPISKDPSTKKDSSPGISFFGPVVIKVLNGFGLTWGLGFLILLARFLYGTASLRNFKKEFIEISDRRITSILKETKRSFPRRTRAEVFLSRKISSPIAMGFFRPLIILPCDLYTRLNDSEIKGILYHELSHIYHRDQITGILQRLVTALNWWNPFVYTLCVDFSRAREEISDNHVLLENNAKEYAECLINLAEKTSLLSRLPVFSRMASPHIPLKKRINKILSKERIMETKLKKSTLAGIALTSFFFISAIAGYRLTFATPGSEVQPANKVILEDESIPETKAEKPSIPLQEKEKAKKEKQVEKTHKPPRLIKKVDPVYPEEARKAGLEDVVILEATTDINGNVVKIEVKKGKYDILNQAAMDSLEQWKYEPPILEGKSMPVTITVTCRFGLKKESKEDIIKVPKDKKLKLLKEVKPVYPEEARKANMEGEVTLEAVIDIEGNVQDVKVEEGENKILNQAAIKAVKQWKYEPYKINGVPQKVRYIVKVRFNLK